MNTRHSKQVTPTRSGRSTRLQSDVNTSKSPATQKSWGLRNSKSPAPIPTKKKELPKKGGKRSASTAKADDDVDEEVKENGADESPPKRRRSGGKRSASTAKADDDVDEEVKENGADESPPKRRRSGVSDGMETKRSTRSTPAKDTKSIQSSRTSTRSKRREKAEDSDIADASNDEEGNQNEDVSSRRKSKSPAVEQAETRSAKKSSRLSLGRSKSVSSKNTTDSKNEEANEKSKEMSDQEAEHMEQSQTKDQDTGPATEVMEPDSTTEDNQKSQSNLSRELLRLTKTVNKKGSKEDDEVISGMRSSRQSIHVTLDSSEEEEYAADSDSEEILDSESDEDLIYDGEEIAINSDVSESSDDLEVSPVMQPNRGTFIPPKASWVSQQTEQQLCNRLIQLETEMVMLRQQHVRELSEKSDAVQRLQNDLNWKNEQLEEMNIMADKNVELESKINFLLSDEENYKTEMEQIQKQAELDAQKAIEAKEKAEAEAKKKEEEDKQKKEKEASKESEDNESDDENTDKSGEKKKRKSRKKKQKEDENVRDEVDAYFVDDDSDVEVIEVKKGTKELEKVPDEKKEEKDEKTDDVEIQGSDNEDEDSPQKGRHNIRKLMGSGKLTEETKQAAKTEKERIERAKKEHDKHLRVDVTDPKTKEPITKQLVLAFKEGTKTPLVEVNQKLIKKLKPHQVSGVEFMWDNIIESMDKLKANDTGAGCLLAHCMGLGKTLSVITLVHTLLTTKAVGFKTCLVVCPLNTVLNWQYEWKKWLDKKDRLTVYELTTAKNNHERADRLAQWKKSGGIMIMGYQLFRILASYSGRSKRVRKILEETLTDPGPHLVVCDEGHILKNDNTAVSKCMNRIKSQRRIVLTGTPLQNNLVEYHCMVNFVKPNLLGSRKEFGNRFINPITNGQHSDSTSRDVKVMKRRAHILHSMLDGCVQRRDYSALTKFLPPKSEYVISVRLSKLQMELYAKYLEINRPEVNLNPGGSVIGTGVKLRGASLFADYQSLMRIWTHPWVLHLDKIRADKKPYTEEDDELESILFVSSDEEEEEVSESSQTSTTEDSSYESTVDVTDAEEDKPSSTVKKTKDDNKAAEDMSSDIVSSGRRTSSRNKSSICKTDTAEEDTVEEESVKTRNTRGKKMDENQGEKRKKDKQTDSEHESDIEQKSSTRATRFKKAKENSSKNDDAKDIRKDKQDKGNKGQEKENKGKSLDKKEDNKKDEGERKAKLVAGEVIKQWQSQSRGDGKVDGVLERKRPDPWWFEYVKEDTKTMLELSGKLILTFEILRMAETVGDKVLVFSQSLLSLDLIEDFLAIKNEEAEKIKTKGKSKASRWVKDEDYCRMDGSTAALSRNRLTNNFNDVKNKKMRLFLISTKAGGLGINLDTANRVIIFDASWNPSHDIQSIFRVYRFGQEKDVFVYRFLAQGTMEEKIYERQVTKETLSQRVIDEHQIDRHFSAADLQELYQFQPDKLDDPDRPARPTPAVPKDVFLAELLSTQKDWIVQYHEHDSLLENRPDEDLSEEERKAAWEEYEREKQGFGALYRNTQIPTFSGLLSNFSAGVRPMLPSLPQSRLPIISLPGGMPSALGAQGLNVQIAQLPRVVQEILKYNPSITSDELSKRLQAFLGMHSRYGSVPGHALGAQGSSQTMNVPIPGFALPQLQQLVSQLPTSSGIGQQLNLGHLPASSFIMPSRIPQPGSVPAMRKE